MRKKEFIKEMASICHERIDAGVPLTVIAIDGRCASGKTTLAAELSDYLEAELSECPDAELSDCMEKKFSVKTNIFHMDDFFLRPEQRTKKRLATPGENVDHERFLEEVLIPLRDGIPFLYKPFSCHDMALLDEPVSVIPRHIAIVEGSYSCHPSLYGYYDFRIFCDIDRDMQLARIAKREGTAAVTIFKEKWIPMEESYFEFYDVRNKCDYILV